MSETMAAPPPHYGFNRNCTCMHPREKMWMMMHMTFFRGQNAEVLFDRWPGTDLKMYAVSLTVVFAMATLMELLSACRLVWRSGSKGNVATGVLRTVLFTVGCGLNYLVMLAVMSFNGGIFLAAVGGHLVGFLVFGSWVSKKSGGPGSVPELAVFPSASC